MIPEQRTRGATAGRPGAAPKTARDHLDLLLAEARIRARCPTATSADFQTSDQNLYGFILLDVTLADGGRLSQADPEGLDDLADEVYELVCDVDWDGVMGEDFSGYVRRPLAIAPGQRPASEPPAGPCSDH